MRATASAREHEQQAIRDAAELETKEADAAAALATRVARAALATVDVTRGEGHGVEPNALLTHVNLQWRNQTDAVVYIQAVRPDSPFTRTIAAHKGGFDAAIIEALRVPEADLHNDEKLGALVQYMLDGVRWTRHTVTDTTPRECAIDDYPHVNASEAT